MPKQDLSINYKVVICDKNKALDIFPRMIYEAGFEPKNYDLVLVKPNICGMYHPEIKLIERTLRFFEARAKRIVIGETNSMIHTPEKQFKRLGILDMLKRFKGGVEALNLMKSDIIELEVPSPHAISKLPIPKLVKECDLLVNIPKVGKHSGTLLTCALKNLFGLLAESNKYAVYHSLGVDKVIADLVKIIRCDLNVVDAGEKIIVGLDPLIIDIYACRLVGLDPLRVKHLKLVAGDRNLRLEEIMGRLEIVEI